MEELLGVNGGLGKFLKNVPHSPISGAEYNYDNEEDERSLLTCSSAPVGVNLFLQAYQQYDYLYDLYLILNKQIDKTDSSSENNEARATRNCGKIRFYVGGNSNYIMYGIADSYAQY